VYIICVSPERHQNNPAQFRVPGTGILIDELQDGLPIGERIAELMNPEGENLPGLDAYTKALEEYLNKEEWQK
jgi:hypothetical protein